MTAEGFDVRYTPADGRPRTLLFVPHEGDDTSDGDDISDGDDTWLRAEFEWTPETEAWRPVGTEPVTGVALFGADSAPAPARAHLENPPEAPEDDDD